MQTSRSEPYCFRVKDVQGTYEIPYIQSSPQLSVQVDFDAFPSDVKSADIVVQGNGNTVLEATVSRAEPHKVFADLPAGEYALSIVVTDRAGTLIARYDYSQIGIGCVVAALGDSLTEGYNGRGFWRSLPDLVAADFSENVVSKNGRNFPQFSPTTHIHRPSVNCFESWMTRLNNALTEVWQQPVFIANEGWGGYTSADYLGMMKQHSGGWCDRMRQLNPTIWLIHLGVNDERHGVSAAQFGANMRRIVELLCNDYGASPGAIYIARPSYDYAPGAAEALCVYIGQIDALVDSMGLQKGPDFFAAFSEDKERWYGGDPVHPGPEGMAYMADLWLEKLRSRNPCSMTLKEPSVLTMPNPSVAGLVRRLCGGNPQTVVCYGTSLTAGGTWVEGLRSELEQKFSGLVQVINSGKGGMNSDWGIQNLDERVIAHDPDAVFLEFSVNDAYLPYNPELSRCEANLREMILRIGDARPTCDIIPMVMNPVVDVHADFRPDLECFNDVYRRVADELGLFLIDHFPAWRRVMEHSRGEFDRLVPDGCHPGPIGCERIILPGILRALGIHTIARMEQP